MLNRLQTFRTRRKLSEADLAKAVSVSRQTIVSIEKGKYDPSLPLAKEIARFFRVAVEDIFPAATEDTVRTTATFVMTDIVGSTALVQELGEEYVDVLRRLREILIEVFTTFGGRVVDDSGDACFAAFTKSEHAVSAALGAQRAIATQHWPGGSDVRIRIGIHTGEAYAVGNRFVGLAVHEAARVCSAAKGGQILVSEATATTGDAKSLKDGGAHDLPGVGRRRLFLIEPDESA
jgi:class 3 adenylate cyclase